MDLQTQYLAVEMRGNQFIGSRKGVLLSQDLQQLSRVPSSADEPPDHPDKGSRGWKIEEHPSELLTEQLCPAKFLIVGKVFPSFSLIYIYQLSQVADHFTKLSQSGCSLEYRWVYSTHHDNKEGRQGLLIIIILFYLQPQPEYKKCKIINKGHNLQGN